MLLPICAAIVYIAWNIAVLLIYRLDKVKAIKSKNRIRERTLLLCAFAMGGFGAFTGMRIFRHKTLHLQFRILVPIAILLNIAAVGTAVYFLL